jgi:GLPGLI family protein
MIRKSLLLLFILTASAKSFTYAQKISEGKLVYEISFPDMQLDEQMKGMMPTESTIYFKDNQIRMEMKMMGMSTVVITDAKDKSATTLMDMMGNKYAVKLTADEIQKEQAKMSNSKYETKLTDETKMIAGYKCKKAIATGKDGNDIIIYYTNEILARNQGFNDQYKGIDGFPMEYQMTQNGMNMRFVAKSVSKEKVEADKFTIPPDYKITTKEEIAKMFNVGK